MAASAFSATRLDDPGGVRYATVTVTPSTSYPTGGEPITAANAGLTQILAILPATTSGGVTWTYIKSTSKLKATRTAAITVAGGAAAASTDALSVKTAVLNKESVGADTVLAQAGLQEVTAAVDLSADTFEILVVGR